MTLVERMREFRSALVLFVAFMLSLSSAFPTVDVSETAYDESESLPYEMTLLFYVGPVPQIAIRTLHRSSKLDLRLDSIDSSLRDPIRSAATQTSGQRMSTSSVTLNCCYRC